MIKFGTAQSQAFPARRQGECPECGFVFPEGTLIRFVPRRAQPVHDECPEPPAAR